MTKIRISPSLTGTPLTEQELKSIIGGRIGFTRLCSCQLYKENDELIRTDILEVENESQCSKECGNNCNNEPQCYKSKYSYYVTNA